MFNGALDEMRHETVILELDLQYMDGVGVIGELLKLAFASTLNLKDSPGGCVSGPRCLY